MEGYIIFLILKYKLYILIQTQICEVIHHYLVNVVFPFSQPEYIGNSTSKMAKNMYSGFFWNSRMGYFRGCVLWTVYRNLNIHIMGHKKAYNICDLPFLFSPGFTMNCLYSNVRALLYLWSHIVSKPSRIDDILSVGFLCFHGLSSTGWKHEVYVTHKVLYHNLTLGLVLISAVISNKSKVISIIALLQNMFDFVERLFLIIHIILSNLFPPFSGLCM